MFGRKAACPLPPIARKIERWPFAVVQAHQGADEPESSGGGSPAYLITSVGGSSVAARRDRSPVTLRTVCRSSSSPGLFCLRWIEVEAAIERHALLRRREPAEVA
jgi:hypothetical protein